MVKYIDTKANFDKILNDANGNLVVVYFTATWCNPCKKISPKFEEMSDEFKDIIFYKVDVDNNQETSESVGISCMPTFYFYKNRNKIDEFSGANEIELREKIIKNK